MDKLTYLAELAEGLARWVPDRERQDILRYYAEYFEEAGPDKEGQVVAELGDPWALSCRLAVEGGYVTQEAANSWTPPRRKRWPWVLAATVVCVVIVAVSVGMAAARFGGWIGRLVSGNINSVTVVEEGAGNYPGYGYMEGEEFAGFWSMEDGYLDPFDAVDADIGLGNITVTGGEDFTLYIQYPENLGGYALKWEIKNGTLKVRDNGGKHNLGGLDGLDALLNAEPVAVIITVPEAMRLSKVEAKTGLGNVFLGTLDTEKAQAETGMGNVECYELRVGKKLKLESGMGDVVLGMDELYSGVELELETGMGNVEANLGCPERECRYEVKTGMGSVTVNGQSRGTKVSRSGSASYKLEIENGMGDVNVSFLAD